MYCTVENVAGPWAYYKQVFDVCWANVVTKQQRCKSNYIHI